MKYTILIISIFLVFSCVSKSKKTDSFNSVKKTDTVNLEIYSYTDFYEFLNKKDDKVYVINFWATWCAPCIKELPFFDEITKKYDAKKVEVILVSLDFPHVFESRLKPFIINKKIKSKVIALNDLEAENWMSKVNKEWAGTIPATLIYKNDSYHFFEKSFTYNELEIEVKKLL